MTHPSTETIAKLSQWDALQLESLKALGWSNGELIERVNNGELPKDDSKFQFDYAGLRTVAAEEPDTFQSAVQNGYTIKYNTIRGIHSWIFLAFKQEAELVLEPGEEAVIANLTAAEAASLAAVLSFGWTLDGEETIPQEINAGNSRSPYRIKPAGA